VKNKKMLKGSLLHELLRYLVYVTDTPLDFYNLALCCRAAAQIAKEYAPMKKKEFMIIHPLFGWPMLPNGMVHGWHGSSLRHHYDSGRRICSVKDRGSTLEIIWPKDCSGVCFLTNNLFIAAKQDFVMVRYVEYAKQINFYNCDLCKRFHFVEFWRLGKCFFYEASCFDKKCQLKPVKRTLSYKDTCRRRRIARKVVDYILSP